jgi:hypothetical protein
MIVEWDTKPGAEPIKASMATNIIYLLRAPGGDELRISQREDGFLIECVTTGAQLIVRPRNQRAIQVEVL